MFKTIIMEKKVVFSLLSDKSILPCKATDGSAGYDVFAYHDCLIPKYSVRKISCGFKMKMYPGLYAQLKSRSSYVLKNVSVEAGTIDSDFRGIVNVCLRNHNDVDVLIKSDSKIAQMIFLKCQYPEIQIGSVDNDTERGEGGFGSTGNN